MESGQTAAVEEMAGHDLYMIKCVVVGDTGVGKTRLICSRACGTRYTLQHLMQTHVPTVWAIDQYRKNPQTLRNSWCVVDGVAVSLRLWDTFGDHGKDRRFAYGRADVVLVCFSVVQPRSLRNIVSHWFREIQQLCPGVPVILCGCQVDLRYLLKDPEYIKMDKRPFFREITDRDVLLPESGRAIAKEIGASYYETSVLEPFGIDTVFMNAARAALIYKRERHFWTALGILKNISTPQFQSPHLPPKPSPPKPPSHLVSPPSSKLQSLVNDSILEGEAFCDVIFMVQNVPIKAHKAVLVAASPIFESLFLAGRVSPMTDSDSLTMLKISDDEECSPSETSTETASLFDVSERRVVCQENRAYVTSSDSTPSSHKSFDQIFTVAEDGVEAVNDISVTIVVVSGRVSLELFGVVLTYLYTGRYPQDPILLTDVEWLSRAIGLTDLADIVVNITQNQDFMNHSVVCNFVKRKSDRLRDVIIKNSLFTDVEFQLDDGIVRAHRALLMSRSEVMSCMFSYEFREKSAKFVSFPGVTTDVFCALQEFLYTGTPPNFHSIDCLAMIELANRLCQTELLLMTQEHLVSELTTFDKSGQDIAEEVLMILEPSQLHNATYLHEWCLWYIAVNYDAVYKRHSKLLHSLRPVIQIYLTNCRWPPVWYHREHDIYEKNVLDLQRQRTIRSCFPFDGCGCLSCFSGRKNRKMRCAGTPISTSANMKKTNA